MTNAETGSSGALESRPRRRLVPIVDARFQWKYTLLIMALGVGLTAIMGGFLYKAHMENTSVLDLSGNQALQAEVMHGDQIFLLYLLILVLLMGLGLGFWGLIVTHRISGPLYIVARYLSVLGGGHYPDMRPLRKRDELLEFFSAFEEAVSAFKARDEASLKEVESALAVLKGQGAGDGKVALDKVVTVLEGQRKMLVEALSPPD